MITNLEINKLYKLNKSAIGKMFNVYDENGIVKKYWFTINKKPNTKTNIFRYIFSYENARIQILNKPIIVLKKFIKFKCLLMVDDETIICDNVMIQMPGSERHHVMTIDSLEEMW